MRIRVLERSDPQFSTTEGSHRTGLLPCALPSLDVIALGMRFETATRQRGPPNKDAVVSRDSEKGDSLQIVAKTSAGREAKQANKSGLAALGRCSRSPWARM